MQKLSMIEASAIIGGTCKETCTSSYETVVVTMKDASDGMCVVPNRIRQ